MFYSLTRFNAHLDDGPSTPLLRWVRGLDPQLLLVINELNIWDLHDLKGTLYGEDRAQALLMEGPQDVGKKYVLQPVSDWIFAQHGFQKTLKEVIVALQSVGIGILRFCVVDHEYEETDNAGAMVEDRAASLVSPTSWFSLMRLDSKPVGHIFTDCNTNIDWLANVSGFSESARAELICKLTDNQIKVEVFDGSRRVMFDFTSLELGGRLIDEEAAEGFSIDCSISSLLLT